MSWNICVKLMVSIIFSLKNESELDAVVNESLPIKARLFIAPYVLLSRIQNALVAKKQATLIEIPEYYFRHELIEAGEL